MSAQEKKPAAKLNAVGALFKSQVEADLIIDARNAGKRYDLVVAGMVLIGLIGLGLDTLVRRMERLDVVRWGFGR